MGKNPTERRLAKFWKDNLERPSLPRGLVGELLNRLGREINTTNMTTIGLTSHLARSFKRMELWKGVVEEYQKAITEDPTAIPNAGTSTATYSQSFGSTTVSAKEDVRDTSDDYRTVTTTLRYITREDNNLADLEQRLVSEQMFNQNVFETFCSVLQDATNMVSFVWLRCSMVIWHYTNLHQIY